MVTGMIYTEAQVNDPTLSVYYNFDEDGDTVKDNSLNGNHGTIVGDVNREEGVYGNAIVLENQSWIDMNGPEFEGGPVDGFTIAVWSIIQVQVIHKHYLMPLVQIMEVVYSIWKFVQVVSDSFIGWIKHNCLQY